MQLINKTSLDLIKGLPEQAKLILAAGYQSKHKHDSDYLDLLQEIREQHAFIKCECLGVKDTYPILGTRKVGEFLALANLPGRPKHADSCPFRYSQATDIPDASSEIPKLVSKTNSGRFNVDNSALETIYPEIVNASQLNRLSSVEDHEDFHERLIDGARLTPFLAKNGAGGKIRFGINSFREIEKELADADDGDFRILISIVDGFDLHTIFTTGKQDKKFAISAGTVIANTNTSEGPFVATTIYSKKGKAVFPVKTSVAACLTMELPIPINSAEIRDLVDALITHDGLFEWIKDKSPGSKPQLIIPVKAQLSPISNTRISPALIVNGNELSCVIADPLKDDKYAYIERGELIWHRSFSPIPGVREGELKKLKRTIAAILMG